MIARMLLGAGLLLGQLAETLVQWEGPGLRIVASGVPFPPGAVRDPGRVVLRSPAGRVVPHQGRALAAWPDGSVRWFGARFAAEPGSEPRRYRWAAGGGGSARGGGAAIEEREGTLTVRAGAWRLVVLPPGSSPLARLAAGGADLDVRLLSWPDGPEGEARDAQVASFSVVEAGPVASVVEVAGELDPSVRFRVRLTIPGHAGPAGLEVTPLPEGGGAPGAAIGLRLEGSGAAPVWAAWHPRGRAAAVPPGAEWRVDRAVLGPVTVTGPDGEGAIHDGTGALLWGSGDATGALAEECGARRGPSSIRIRGEGAVDAVLFPAGVPAGSALRRRLRLLWGRPGPEGLGAAARALAREAAALPGPAELRRPGILGGRALAPPSGELRRRLDAAWTTYGNGADALSLAGDADDGDTAHELGGTANLEHDALRALLLRYAATGDLAVEARVRAAARHWVGRDLDRAGTGLPRRHGPDHDGGVDLGHVWLEGAFQAGAALFDEDLLAAADGVAAALAAAWERAGTDPVRAWDLVQSVRNAEAWVRERPDAADRALAARLRDAVRARRDRATGLYVLGAPDRRGRVRLGLALGASLLEALAEVAEATGERSWRADVAELGDALAAGLREAPAPVARALWFRPGAPEETRAVGVWPERSLPVLAIAYERAHAVTGRRVDRDRGRELVDRFLRGPDEPSGPAPAIRWLKTLPLLAEPVVRWSGRGL
jgi:hypothetical protein